jgi:hypothetical protein
LRNAVGSARNFRDSWCLGVLCTMLRQTRGRLRLYPWTSRSIFLHKKVSRPLEAIREVKISYSTDSNASPSSPKQNPTLAQRLLGMLFGWNTSEEKEEELEVQLEKNLERQRYVKELTALQTSLKQLFSQGRIEEAEALFFGAEASGLPDHITCSHLLLGYALDGTLDRYVASNFASQLRFANQFFFFQGDEIFGSYSTK